MLSYVFVFGFEPYYDVYAEQPERLFGLSPARRPAPRRRRDDGRAGAHARRRPRPALPERPSRQAGGAAPRRAGRVTPSPWSFSFEPLYLLLAAVAVALYVRAWRRSPGSAWRAASFAAGLLLVVGALNSPLGTIATEYLVLFHLLQNVMISDWAPPLLLIGLTPAMRAAVAARGGHVFATLTRPEIALPIWLVGWYVVHLGAVYDAAVREPRAPRARARLPDRDRPPLLVARALRRAAVGRDARPARLRVRRVRALGVPRARADVLAADLRLLRVAPRAALGDLRREGPEPRRDPHVERAGPRLLRRDRVAPRPAPPRGGRGGAAACGGAARRRAAESTSPRSRNPRERDPAARIPRLRRGHIPEGARWRGRNYLLARTGAATATSTGGAPGTTAAASRAWRSVVRTISFARAKLSSSVGTGPTRCPSA